MLALGSGRKYFGNREIMELQESKQRMMDRGGNCRQPIFGNLSNLKDTLSGNIKCIFHHKYLLNPVL